MAVFMDRNGYYYVAVSRVNSGDMEKPIVSQKLVSILEDAGIPLNEEDISKAIVALESGEVATQEKLL